MHPSLFKIKISREELEEGNRGKALGLVGLPFPAGSAALSVPFLGSKSLC